MSKDNHIKEDDIYMPSPPSDPQCFQRTVFKAYEFQRLKKMALSGNIAKVGSRVFCWRIFLKILDRNGNPKIWVDEIQKQREEYYQKFQEFKVSKKKDFDPNLFNPLMPSVPSASTSSSSSSSSSSPSKSQQNPFDFLFKDSELKNTIRQDIERTYQEQQFFRQSYVKDQMMQILFLWSRTHPEISYRQGMNEILGTIFFLFHSEKIKNAIDDTDLATQSAANLLQFMNNQKYLIPDMYTIFNTLMKMGVKELFLPHQSTGKNDLESREKVKSLRKTEELFYFNFDRPSTLQIINDKVAKDLSPLMKRCCRIYNFYLKTLDKELYDHLLKEKIEPQIHLTRWLRCMLNRQFHIEDVLKFWDAFFCFVQQAKQFNQKDGEVDIYAMQGYYEKDENDPLIFMDLVCLTMIIFVREYLLLSDNSGCLLRLMKYPPLEDPQMLIKRANDYKKYLFRKEKFPDAISEQVKPVISAALMKNNKSSKDANPLIKQQKSLEQSSPKQSKDTVNLFEYDEKNQDAIQNNQEDEEEDIKPQKIEPKPKKEKKISSAFGLLNPLAALSKAAEQSKARKNQQKSPVRNKNPIQTKQKKTPLFDEDEDHLQAPPQKKQQAQKETKKKSSFPPRFSNILQEQKQKKKIEKPQQKDKLEQEEEEQVVVQKKKKAPAMGLLRFEPAKDKKKQDQTQSEKRSKYFSPLHEENPLSNSKKKEKNLQSNDKVKRAPDPDVEESPEKNSILSLTNSFLSKGKKERQLIDQCRYIRTVLRKTKEKQFLTTNKLENAITAVDYLEEFVRNSFKNES